MRAAADALRAEAKRIENGVAALKAGAARTTFVGPAGDRFRSDLRGITSQAERAGSTLFDLARLLMETADQAQLDIAEAQRAREEILRRRSGGQ